MKRFKKGFSIVELMVYMALMAIFLVILTELFVSALDTQSQAEAMSSVDVSGRYINSRFFYDLQRGKTITMPASLGATSTTLSFTDIDNHAVSYSLVGSNLILNLDGVSYQLNDYNTSVSGLSFTLIGNGLGKEDTVRISYTITSAATRETAGVETRSFQTTVGLRPN